MKPRIIADDVSKLRRSHMHTVSSMEPHIESEFGLRLEPLGFRPLGQRKWVRSQKSPIREMFLIGNLKGGSYCPIWGFSCGFAPSFQRQTFRRQSTDKNAVMDLVIDPIDITGDVPPQAFSFLTGHDVQLPKAQIQTSAEYFVPMATADFDRVTSVLDFCQFFLVRSRLQYRRFSFNNYLQHQLVFGFVLILTDQFDKGMERIRKFCRDRVMDFENRILMKYIRHAELERAKA